MSRFSHPQSRAQDAQHTTYNGLRTAQLIVALDVDTLKEARHLVDLLYPAVRIFKVGIQLFTATGPKVVEMIKEKDGQVFLDLKFYDIPNTVASAVRQATEFGVFMLDMHIQGGKEMLRLAISTAKTQAERLKIKPPLLLGITVLTSQKESNKVKQLILRQAELGKRCGLDGVITSAREAAFLRQKLGEDFLLVTPGIRTKGDACFDQKRTASPKEAVLSGSDYLVVGRPIIKAKDPLEVARTIVEEIRE